MVPARCKNGYLQSLFIEFRRQAYRLRLKLPPERAFEIETRGEAPDA
jgi:hypothetical protein